MKLRLTLVLLAAVFTGAAAAQEVEHVVITGSRIHVPERRPKDKIAFPEIKDWSTLRITLLRGRCLGACPDYSVEIRGDGWVRYHGSDQVAVSGGHRFKIPVERVHALVDTLRKAEFFWLFDGYFPVVSDARYEAVGIAFDGREKTVREAAGDWDGLPASVSAAMDAIDDAANTKLWIEGDGEAFDALQAEHWDFHARTDENSRLIGAAAQKRKLTLLVKLLEAGVPVDMRGGCEALANAAFNRDLATVQLLVAKGASSYWSDPAGEGTCSALSAALSWNSGEDPDMVREILKLHPNVDRPAYGFTPLTSLAIEGAAMNDGERASELARLLIAAGADPNARNADGAPALLYCHGQPDMVRTLIKAGARPDIQDKDGHTALMDSWSPEGTGLLLDAGADPYLKDKDGKTALDRALPSWGTAPILTAWMAAHPPK